MSNVILHHWNQVLVLTAKHSSLEPNYLPRWTQVLVLSLDVLISQSIYKLELQSKLLVLEMVLSFTHCSDEVCGKIVQV